MPEEPKDNQKPAMAECAPNAAQKPAIKRSSKVITNGFPSLYSYDWTKLTDDGTSTEFRSSPKGSWVYLQIGSDRFDHPVPAETTITIRRIPDGRFEVLFPYEFKP